MTTSPHASGSGPQFNNPVIRWIEYRLPIFSFADNFMGAGYPAPRNLSYWWNFGSLAGIALVLQIMTGVVLAMTYVSHVDMAFDSVERIMRDVNFGWLLRYAHANGASMFFIVVFIHLFRGLYYGSYKSPRELLWMLGVIILLLMMATAFMGYVLPWGQMSFWGATVITNLFSAIPLATPAHIVPEWYFLPYYAILRGIPDKLLGVIAMFGSILVLFILPWLDTAKVRSS